MSASKAKKEPSPRKGLPAIVAELLFVRGRRMTLAVLMVALFAGSMALLWRHVRPRVVEQPEYQVGLANLNITPLPPWIHSDPKGDVLRSLSLDAPLSILNEQLTERVHDAFRAHPWIAKVERVAKHHPARVQVDLVYRCPVCMVEVAARRLPGTPVEATATLLPVDVEGVLLPEGDFSIAERAQYPRLAGIDSMPLGAAGARWGDGRVHGGAAVAASLREVWSELGLERILLGATASGSVEDEYAYEIETRGGTRILWGFSPRTHRPGELPAAEKIARLKKHVAEHGSLEAPDGPQTIDVRHWDRTIASPRMARR
jgi:hypothetical protein